MVNNRTYSEQTMHHTLAMSYRVFKSLISMRSLSLPVRQTQKPEQFDHPQRDTQYVFRLTNERPSHNSFVFIWSGRAHETRPNFEINLSVSFSQDHTRAHYDILFARCSVALNLNLLEIEKLRFNNVRYLLDIILRYLLFIYWDYIILLISFRFIIKI